MNVAVPIDRSMDAPRDPRRPGVARISGAIHDRMARARRPSCATRTAAARAGRRREIPAAAPRAGQAAGARADRPAARSRLAVPRAVAARRLGHVRQRGAGRRHRHRHRPRVGPRSADRRQRRDGQGRHLLPDDGEEAPARAADRAREPAAVRLPRRLGRRVPAAAGRGLSRIASTSAASSSTRRGCRPSASRRSPS